jgi:hypothetical protein
MIPPPLPVELWTMIIHHATDVPGALNTSPLPPVDDAPRSWTVQSESRDFISSRKGMLMCVSRRWRELSIPAVYEYIRAGRPVEQLPSLLRTLRKRVDISPHESSPGKDNTGLFGSYAKRIDIIFSPTRKANTAATMGANLAALASLCPNLRVLSIRQLTHSRDAPPDLLKMFLNCVHLRHIEIHLGGLGIVVPRTEYIQEVEVLILDAILLIHDSETETLPKLPKLHTLHVYTETDSASLEYIDRWEMPELRRLTLGIDFEDDSFQEFFKKHGPYLTSLDLRLSNDASISKVLVENPSLQELSIQCSIFDNYSSRTQLHHKNLKKISLYFFCESEYNDEELESDELMKHFSKAMRLLSQMDCPCLQTLQLIDFDESSFREEDSEWRSSHLEEMKKWINEWSVKGVTFRGKSGNPLSIPYYVDGDSWDWNQDPPADILVTYREGVAAEEEEDENIL